MADSLVIRSMRKEDISLLHSWVVQEGWQPGDGDLSIFFEALPETFWIGELEGEIVAMISLVSYASGQFGFLGYYIVRPDKRGNGYGMKMWKQAMEKASNVTVVGLDGVTLQVPRYEKSGFETAHTNHRFLLQAPPSALQPPKEGVSYREASETDLEDILLLDAAMVPPAESRSKLVRLWLQQPGSRAVVALRGGRVTGVAAGRPSGPDLRLSPIYAQDPEDASALLSLLLDPQWQRRRRAFIDVPAANKAGMEWARAAGLEEVGQTARMYKGPPPPTMAYENVFSVLSLEVG